MEDKIGFIAKWLETGSFNVFGLPMSGKDTVGKRLARDLSAKFLSSGDIIREYEVEHQSEMTASGALIPTNAFYDIVLPYFSHSDLDGYSLVLSSIGRWEGEEIEVMAAAEKGGHPIKLALELTLSEDEVRNRWKKARETGDRGERPDDLKPEIFEVRIKEYHEKTEPVLEHYAELGKLIRIDGVGTRDEVYERVIEAIDGYIST